MVIHRPGARPERLVRPTARPTTADFERAKTWLPTIAEACLTDPDWVQEGDERKYKGTGGLHINMQGRGWFDHSAKLGGGSAIALVMYLKKCSSADAVAWLIPFLKNYQGTGPCAVGNSGSVDDDDATPASAADCQDVLDRLRQEMANTPSELYLESRALPGPYPVGLGHVDNARVGEGAFVAKLTAHGRVTGVMLTYLTPAGEKSLIEPVRRRLNLEKSPGVVFRIPAPRPTEKLDTAADYLIGEGVEDALSLALLDRNLTILGVPGVGTIQDLDFPKGAKITVVRDGDEPGSEPDKALTAGVDALLLAGCVVRVTKTPPSEDANSILQKQGLDALRLLVARPPEALLSFDGRIIRLSKITDPVAYAKERKAVSEIFMGAEEKEDRVKISVALIDGEVKKLRRDARATAAAPADDDGAAQGRGHAVLLPVIEPWPERVGAEVLDQVSAKIREYLILHRHQADTTALWVVFTHLADRFDVSPKLIINSAQKRSGKSRALEVLDRLVAKSVSAASITTAAFVRVIDRHAPTLLLDEFDAMLKGDPEKAEALRGLLNSGFDRAKARRMISVPLPGGGWEERWYSTFCSQAIAGIGDMPDTVADRSIRIEMRRKLRTEKVAPLRLRDGADLYELSRKIARLAADHGDAIGTAKPAVPPELNDRAADAWAPLLAIADAAGGEWPKRAREVAIRLSGGEDPDTDGTLLLSDIRAYFAEQDAEQQPVRVASEALVTALIDLEDRPWGEISRGKGLTKHGLARRLAPFHISPSTVQIGVGKAARDVKGYYLRQFTDAFARYLSPLPGGQGGKQTVGTSEAAENKGFQPDFKPSEEGGSDDLKTPREPQEIRGSDAPTVQNREGGPRGKKETSDTAQDTTPAQPNNAASTSKSQRSATSPPPEPEISARSEEFTGGAPAEVSPTPKSRRSSLIEERVRATADAHPDWNSEQIGNACGRTASVVRQILGTGAQP